MFCLFFFFNDTATTEIYTLSLHDALPIYGRAACGGGRSRTGGVGPGAAGLEALRRVSERAIGRLTTKRARRPASRMLQCGRSEEHTSELQSRQYLVCRLLLEKKKQKKVSTSRHPFLLKPILHTVVSRSY